MHAADRWSYQWWWWRSMHVLCYYVVKCSGGEFAPNRSVPNYGERAKSGGAKGHFGWNMKCENSGKVCISIDHVETSSVRYFFSKMDRQKLRKSIFRAATNKLTRCPPSRPPAKFFVKPAKWVKSSLSLSREIQGCGYPSTGWGHTFNAHFPFVTKPGLNGQNSIFLSEFFSTKSTLSRVWFFFRLRKIFNFC